MAMEALEAAATTTDYCCNASFLLIFIAREIFIDKDNRITIHAATVYLSACANEWGRLPLTLYFIS
jgi:hypothetical protein